MGITQGYNRVINSVSCKYRFAVSNLRQKTELKLWKIIAKSLFLIRPPYKRVEEHLFFLNGFYCYNYEVKIRLRRIYNVLRISFARGRIEIIL